MSQDFLFLRPTKYFTMKNSKWTVLTIIGFILYACSPKIAPAAPTETITETNAPIAAAEPLKENVKELVKGETALTPELAEGKSLYENKCGNCHKLFPASKHDKEGWEQTMYYMAPKARLTEDQKKLVYNYLTAGL